MIIAYNNKAIVRDSSERIIFSENGNAYVIEDVDLGPHLSNIVSSSSSLSKPFNETGDDKTFRATDKVMVRGLISSTINVFNGNEEIKEALDSIRYNGIIDHTPHYDLGNVYDKIYIGSKPMPTNISYPEASANVVDNSDKESNIQFGGISTNVRSKAEIIIPNFSSRGNIDITVQKDCFMELQLPENIIGVIKLPDFLQYVPGFIKGTPTQSGVYTLIIEYADGEQVITISVPYYKSIL